MDRQLLVRYIILFHIHTLLIEYPRRRKRESILVSSALSARMSAVVYYRSQHVKDLVIHFDNRRLHIGGHIALVGTLEDVSSFNPLLVSIADDQK